MTYHRKHHRRHHHNPHHGYHRRHHRHNPFGVTGGTVKDAVYVAAGAVVAGTLPGMVLPKQNTGWTGVALTGAAAVAASFIARMIGGPAAAAEALKGGLAAAVIRAMHEAGFAKNLGLGLYASSWFGIPTASSQHLRAAQANLGPFARGAGTIFFPGPGTTAAVTGPSGQQYSPAALAMSGMGYHRFRSRYAGGYG